MGTCGSTTDMSKGDGGYYTSLVGKAEFAYKELPQLA